jgi:hypothetical protein
VAERERYERFRAEEGRRDQAHGRDRCRLTSPRAQRALGQELPERANDQRRADRDQRHCEQRALGEPVQEAADTHTQQ